MQRFDRGQLGAGLVLIERDAVSEAAGVLGERLQGELGTVLAWPPAQRPRLMDVQVADVGVEAPAGDDLQTPGSAPTQ